MSRELSQLFCFAVSKTRPELLQHLDTVCWLTDESVAARRSGRSAVMALAFLKHAISNPGTSVHLMDHVGNSGVQFVSRFIKDWIAESGLDVPYHLASQFSLKFLNVSSSATVQRAWRGLNDPKDVIRRTMSHLMANGHSYEEIRLALDEAAAARIHSE